MRRTKLLHTERVASGSLFGGPMPESMEALVKFQGATAASWLIWAYRKSIHRSGAVDFKIPRSATTPPWFRVAVETLNLRQNWSVTLTGSTLLERNYRIRWLQHGNFKRSQAD